VTHWETENGTQIPEKVEGDEVCTAHEMLLTRQARVSWEEQVQSILFTNISQGSSFRENIWKRGQ
jgi:hypothetical protein